MHIPVRERDFSLLQNVQTGFGAHSAYYSMGTRVLSRRLSGRSVKITTHLHLVTKSRISGAIPLLPLYAFMAWRGEKLYFYEL
jgi:hypothetical protein